MYLASLQAGPNGLTTSQFLQAVLPQIDERGTTYALGFHELGSSYGVSERHLSRTANPLFPDPDELANWSVWFTPSLFREQKRAQVNAYAAQSLWTDLDVDPTGAKPGTYASVQDAWAAIWQFAQVAQFFPHIVVDSGRGLQVFWLLSRPVNTTEWQQLALRLSVILKTNGVRYDPSRATDIASWMRLPGVQNPKPGARVASVVYWGSQPRWSPENLIQAWGHIVVAHLMADLIGKVNGQSITVPQSCWDLRSNMDLSDFQLSWADFCSNANGAHCPRITWAIQPQNQPYIAEPEWYALLGFFRAFEGGRWLAHEASRYHPGYDPAATDRKYFQWQGRAPSRATFQTKLTNIPGAPSCDTCPNAHACKSPAQWGKRVPKVIPIQQVQPAPQQQQIAQPTMAPQPMSESAAVMSEDFDYGHAGEAWGMWTSIKRETSTGIAETRIHLCKQRIYPRRIVKVKQSDNRGNSTQETCLHVDVISRDNVSRPMYIPLADLDSQHKTLMIRALHDAGCSNPGHGWNNAGPIEWKGFMTRLLTQARTMAMSETGLPDQAHSHLGWADDTEGTPTTDKFVLGAFAYGKEGAVERAVIDADVAKFARGVPAPMTDESYAGGMQALASDFNRLLAASIPAGAAGLPDRFALSASLATCIQALCVPEIERGGVVVFHNDGSGTGKTSLLRRAMSLWNKLPGDWIQQDATMQGFVERRLQVAHSLPVVWDDMIRSMSKEDSNRFADFVLRSTGKQQRIRQTTSTTGAWTTFAFASMNPHPHGLIANESRDASNALNRVLAVSVPPGRLTAATRPAQAAYDAWADEHGGKIGQLFLRSIISDAGRQHARDRYEAWRNYIRQSMKSEDGNERFNRSIVASVLTAAELATQLGLLHEDLNALATYCIDLLNVTRTVVTESVASADNITTEFLTYAFAISADLQVQAGGAVSVVRSTPGTIRANRVRDMQANASMAIIPIHVVEAWAKSNHCSANAIRQSITTALKASVGTAMFYTGAMSHEAQCLLIPVPDLTNPLEDICPNTPASSPAPWTANSLPSQRRPVT